jgi:hypothetical protein
VKLSVLIPTVSPRRSLLSRLLWSVTSQLGDFEIVVHAGDDIPMGDKLNRMFTVAKGEYVVCVDDDDMLADSYMEQVLPKCGDVDFVGYRILVLHDGAFWMEVEHRGDVSGWGETIRGVGPKCPIRRELALQVPFGNAYTDDQRWSLEVGRLVKTSAYVDRPLYVYDWWESHMLGTAPDHQTDRWGTQRDVGMWPFRQVPIVWLT